MALPLPLLLLLPPLPPPPVSHILCPERVGPAGQFDLQRRLLAGAAAVVEGGTGPLGETLPDMMCARRGGGGGSSSTNCERHQNT